MTESKSTISAVGVRVKSFTRKPNRSPNLVLNADGGMPMSKSTLMFLLKSK